MPLQPFPIWPQYVAASFVQLIGLHSFCDTSAGGGFASRLTLILPCDASASPRGGPASPVGWSVTSSGGPPQPPSPPREPINKPMTTSAARTDTILTIYNTVLSFWIFPIEANCPLRATPAAVGAEASVTR